MFKRFTLLLSLAVIASISIMAVTNLWSGSQYLEGNELTVENKDGSLSNLSIGDKITITFTNTEESELKISIITEGGEKTLYEDYHLAANSGSVSFDVNQDFIDGIKKDNKFKIMAKKMTITSIDASKKDDGGEEPDPVDPPADDTFSGVAEIQGLTFQLGENWYDVMANNGADKTAALYIKPQYMPGIQAGDEIRIYFEADGGQANFVFLGLDNEWNKRGENNSANPDWIDYISGNTAYSLKVENDDMAAALAANGLWVDGKQNKVAKVEFVYNKHAEEVGEIVADKEENPEPGPEQPEDPEGNYTTRVLWQQGDEITSVNGVSTELVLGNDWLTNANDGGGTAYTQAFHIPAEKFFPFNDNDTKENSDLDDCIVVTFSSFEPGAQASFYFKDNEGVWFKRGVGDSNSVQDHFDVDHTGTYERYILNYRTVAALRTDGLYIDGKNATISKIELRNYENSALTDEHPYFIGNPKNDAGAGVETERGYIITPDTEATIDWTTNRRIRPRAFTNYVNGERIVLIFNKLSDDIQLRLSYIRPFSANMRVAQGLTGDNDGIANADWFTTLPDGRVSIEYRPTQREIRALKFNGLFLAGQGLELSEITFGLAKADDQTQDLWIHNDWMTFGHEGEGKIYEGDLYTSGDVRIYISNIHFKRAQDLNWLAQANGEYNGYKLTFFFPWVGSGATMTLSYDSANVHESNRDPLNMYFAAAYPEVSISQAPLRAAAEPESGIYAENISLPEGKTRYYDHPLSSDDVKKMINYGVWLEGSNADMQNIFLRSPISVSGTESVEDEVNLLDFCIDFNLPYEAYTIDGRRVADIDAPGLYIVRQGNKVQKILRR